jgi:hypothetical protein
LQERRALLGICPACRRTNDVSKLVELNQEAV